MNVTPHRWIRYVPVDGNLKGKTVGGNTTTYTWDVGAGLPAILQDGTYTYVYGKGLISQTDGLGLQTYLLADGLGSTAALTDGVLGLVTATYKYDVFGAVRSQTGVGSTEYRFTGQQDDATLGYTYLRARYYDPSTGRFLSKDPFPGDPNIPANLHHFVYVQNNPVNLTDPSGKCAFCVVMLVGAMIGGGADLVSQLVENEGDWSRISFGQVVLNAAAGAVSGGYGGAISKIGRTVGKRMVGYAVSSGAISGLTTSLENVLFEDEDPLQGAGESFVEGALLGLVGGRGAELIGEGRIIDPGVAQALGTAVASSADLFEDPYFPW